MNTHDCTVNIGRELKDWHDRLATLTGRIDALPSIEKFRLTPYIEGLHILLAEMDDRLGELGSRQVTTLRSGMVLHPSVIEREACNFNECEGVTYDYDFGG